MADKDVVAELSGAWQQDMDKIRELEQQLEAARNLLKDICNQWDGNRGRGTYGRNILVTKSWVACAKKVIGGPETKEGSKDG